MTHPASDPLNDPRFPDRPSHKDFWALSQLVLQLDGQTGDRDATSIISEVIEFDSLQYMAIQRGMRSTTASVPPLVAAAGLYLEAFLIGYRYRDQYGNKNERNDNEADPNGKDTT